MSAGTRRPRRRLEIDIAEEGGPWPEATARWLVTAAEAAYADAAGPAASHGTAEAALSVLLADDARVQALNRDFRGKYKPTNVLSFPAEADDFAAQMAAAAGEPAPLGDLAFAWETLAREAEAEGKTVADHLRHLVVHGVLHLMGMDHETDDDAARMESREIAILATLGVPDPYAGTEPAHAADPPGGPAADAG